jgi:hypothetical protein
MLGKEWLKKIDLRKMVGEGKEGKRLVVECIFAYQTMPNKLTLKNFA